MTGRSLQDFFNMLRSAQRANRVRFADCYDVIERIDRCFIRAGKNLINPKPLMTASLLLRCQYAFKTTAGLALAGQVAEPFVMQRSVLEYAGYCLMIYETPALQEVFLSRHIGNEEMSVQRKAFQIGPVRTSIGRNDAKLAEHFDLFYQRSIDFGAHPNPHATMSATVLDKTGFTPVALTDDPEFINFALKSTAEVGLTALCVLQHVFKERFELLGIRQEIDTLKASCLLRSWTTAC
jgi:hypothetical protein